VAITRKPGRTAPPPTNGHASRTAANGHAVSGAAAGGEPEGRP
jgi:hypothetical protein